MLHSEQAPRHPLPPFNEASARQKVLMAEAAWNSRDPERVAAAYSPGSERREASINDVAIGASDRRMFGPRPEGDLSGMALQ